MTFVPPEVLKPDQLKEKAETELHETDAGRIDALIAIRSLIMKVDGKEAVMYDFPRMGQDNFLLAFLRARKFNVEAAFKTLTNFARFRHAHPVYFEGTAASVKAMIESGMTGVLQHRTPLGEPIMVIYMGKQDKKRFSFTDMMQMSVFTSLAILESPETQISGVVMIEDLTGMSMFDGPTMSESRESFEWMQDCLPMRLKGIHIVNAPWYVQALIAMVKPFMKKKLQKRFHLHKGDLSTLHAIIPSSILPTEFGGTVPFDSSQWLRDYTSLSIAPHEVQIILPKSL